MNDKTNPNSPFDQKPDEAEAVEEAMVLWRQKQEKGTSSDDVIMAK